MNVKPLEPAASKGQATSAKEISTREGPLTSLAWRPSSKIRDRHWQRLAIVYIRQSSPYQVLENRESRERQYGLAQLAQQLGWPADRVLVIDEDQGLSGKSSENRSGFQRLLTEVTRLQPSHRVKLRWLGWLTCVPCRGRADVALPQYDWREMRPSRR